MARLFSFVTALIFFSGLSPAFAQDHAEAGISPDASEVAEGGTGLAAGSGQDHEHSGSDPLPMNRLAEAPLAPAGKETDSDAHDTQSCSHCNESEQLVVDLNYYKQITDILKGINENYEGINEATREKIRSMIARINPDLVDMLFRSVEQETPRQIMPGEVVNYSTVSPMPEFGASATEQPGEYDELKKEFAMLKQELGKIKRRDSAAEQKSRRDTTGIAGLILRHVNGENPLTGTQARVVVSSHDEIKHLSLNDTFKHNDNEFVVKVIEKQSDDSSSHLHLVTVENTTTGETHNISW